MFAQLLKPQRCFALTCLCASAGNLRTSDRDGPYNFTLLSTQVAEVKSEFALSRNLLAAVESPGVSVCPFELQVESLQG